MVSNQACIIYLSSYAGSVETVEQRLESLGYEVRSFEVTEERARAVVAGDRSSLPDELRACLENADLCVLLLGIDADYLGPIGGLGSDMGCRVITVGGDPDSVPTELDDVGDGHIPDIESPAADEVLGGERARIKGDGTPLAERKPKRQKCQ